jgi:hypothetical protein
MLPRNVKSLQASSRHHPQRAGAKPKDAARVRKALNVDNGGGQRHRRRRGGGGEQLAKIVRGETFHRRNFRVGIGRGCRPFRGMRLRKKRFDAEKCGKRLADSNDRSGTPFHRSSDPMHCRRSRPVCSAGDREVVCWARCAGNVKHGGQLGRSRMRLIPGVNFQFTDRPRIIATGKIVPTGRRPIATSPTAIRMSYIRITSRNIIINVPVMPTAEGRAITWSVVSRIGRA